MLYYFTHPFPLCAQRLCQFNFFFFFFLLVTVGVHQLIESVICLNFSFSSGWRHHCVQRWWLLTLTPRNWRRNKLLMPLWVNVHHEACHFKWKINIPLHKYTMHYLMIILVSFVLYMSNFIWVKCMLSCLWDITKAANVLLCSVELEINKC